jgi:hypothetical protein
MMKDKLCLLYSKMPYIHWEKIRTHKVRQDALDKVAGTPEVTGTKKPPTDEEWDDLPMSTKLLIAFNWEKSPIHDRRTLDQAFYYTLPAKDIRERDQDQVLSKYMANEDDLKDDPYILMVDQLWMWILDTPTTGPDGEKIDTSITFNYPYFQSLPP